MKINPLFVVGALVLMMIGFFVGQKSSHTDSATTATLTQNPTNPSVSMAVEATTPRPDVIDEYIVANGVIHPKDTAQISAKTQGVIEQVLVEVGDVVQKGQILAVLDDDVMKDNLTQANADLATATATLDKARADLARVEPLLAIDAVSHQEVDMYRANLTQAAANLNATKARLNTAKKNLADTHIKSPVAGVVSEKTAQVGMTATGSLFTVIKDGRLEWQATINPRLADKLTQGMSAKLSVGNQTIMGNVSHLSPTANQSREIIVHVDLPRHELLKAGMYQTGQFVISQQNVHTIPSSALINTDGDDYVWRLIATERADIYQTKRQQVHILAHEGDKVATDLPAQTLIVANGVSFLSDDELVKVVSVMDKHANQQPDDLDALSKNNTQEP